MIPLQDVDLLLLVTQLRDRHAQIEIGESPEMAGPNETQTYVITGYGICSKQEAVDYINEKIRELDGITTGRR